MRPSKPTRQREEREQGSTSLFSKPCKASHVLHEERVVSRVRRRLKGSDRGLPGVQVTRREQVAEEAHGLPALVPGQDDQDRGARERLGGWLGEIREEASSLKLSPWAK